MRFYEKYFKSNFEELIRFYPRYYREVYEMVEILKANGAVLDTLEDGIEISFLNDFIDYADEETIKKLERFLRIALNKSQTLSERRRLVKAFFVGFGKISATVLKGLISTYTNAPVDVKFEPSDAAGNNTLFINFDRGKEEHLYMSDIIMLLSRKIPAHLNWRASIVYRHGIGIGVRRTNFPIEYKLSGTIPEIALIGSIYGVSAVTEKHLLNYKTDHVRTSPNELAGTIPNTATIGVETAARSVVEKRISNYIKEHEASTESALEAGTLPLEALLGQILGVDIVSSQEHENHISEHRVTGALPEHIGLGKNNRINAGAEVTVTDIGIDYMSCGEDLI